MLTKEEVMHVAHLARIEITLEELEKYQKDLKVLFMGTPVFAVNVTVPFTVSGENQTSLQSSVSDL